MTPKNTMALNFDNLKKSIKEDLKNTCEDMKCSIIMEMKNEIRLSTSKYFKEIADLKVLLNSSQININHDTQTIERITFQDSEESITLPLTTMNDLKFLEEKMQNEVEKGNLVHELSMIGGDQLKSVSRHIMRKLLNKELSLKFSLQGKGKLNKLSFKDLELYKCVVGKCLKYENISLIIVMIFPGMV